MRSLCGGMRRRVSLSGRNLQASVKKPSAGTWLLGTAVGVAEVGPSAGAHRIVIWLFPVSLSTAS
jgi:hypothetical protein